MLFRQHRCGMKNIDMTSGSIWRKLVAFSLPILLGELFQQLYSTVDTLILGNFASATEMAAVGGTGNVINVLIGFFNGVSIGCTVVTARFYGAKDREKLTQAVHTIVLLSVALGVLLSVVGILITKPVLSLLDLSDTVMPYAVTYVRIYFAGLLGVILYNIVTGILRAVGNVRLPLIALVLSAVLNVILDLLFVIRLKKGVAGVAIATAFSQAIAALMCFVILNLNKADYRFRLRGTKFSFAIVGQVLAVGVPIGIQKMLTSLSNVLVLSYITPFGDASLAGWVVYTKVSRFVILGLQSIGSSVTTFVSQNLGAGRYDRVWRGVRIGLLESVILTVSLSLLIVLFRRPIAMLFGHDEQMLVYAEIYLVTVVPLLILHVPHSLLSAALRSLKRAGTATMLMITGLVVVRQIYLMLITKLINTPQIVSLSFPVGWVASGSMLLLCYLLVIRKLFRNPPI